MRCLSGSGIPLFMSRYGIKSSHMVSIALLLLLTIEEQTFSSTNSLTLHSMLNSRRHVFCPLGCCLDLPLELRIGDIGAHPILDANWSSIKSIWWCRSILPSSKPRRLSMKIKTVSMITLLLLADKHISTEGTIWSLPVSMETKDVSPDMTRSIYSRDGTLSEFRTITGNKSKDWSSDSHNDFLYCEMSIMSEKIANIFASRV